MNIHNDNNNINSHSSKLNCLNVEIIIKKEFIYDLIRVIVKYRLSTRNVMQVRKYK